MYKHHHIGIQFFAEPGAENPPTEGQQETGGSSEQTGGNEPLTFDQWLDSNPAFRSEFDRRNTKAVQTARTKWEQEQAENLDEATKLANMTAAQREKYQLGKDRDKLDAERAAFQRQQLEVQTGAQLQGMGYDAAFAKYLTGADAEATAANLVDFDTRMQAYKAGAIKSQMRGQGAPKDPHHGSGLTRESLRGMTPQEISKAFDEGKLDSLLKSK
ncbi:MAG: DUF4355 domain-containing protein [Clostridiales bacterium]|nr:DUF4355 domain-containing protein [Clostridiales bacterium]